MIHSTPTVSRFPLLRPALVALCAVVLAAVQVPSLRAADSQASRMLDDKAPALPLTATFEKVASTEDGPYVLHLKNDSKDSIKATAKVFPSVSFHANSKSRDIPLHVVNSGEDWSITGLAASDKVTVSADGYSPLELTVP